MHDTTDTTTLSVPTETQAPTTGRRRLIVGLAGAAAAGVAASAFDPAGVARAADGDPILIGQDNDGTLLTQLRRPTGATDIDVLSASDATDAVTTSPHPAALAGTAAGNTVYNGVHGLASSRVDAEVITGFGLIGHATDDARAPLWLVPRADPNDDTIEHQVGEVVVDADGHFWACVAAGTPGTWIDLAAPLVDTTELQPQYFPIDPIRCYDSREAAYAPNDGMIDRLESRVVSVANSYDRAGTLLTADVVPAGRRAQLLEHQLRRRPQRRQRVDREARRPSGQGVLRRRRRVVPLHHRRHRLLRPADPRAGPRSGVTADDA